MFNKYSSLNLNTDKILAATKYWWQQNAGAGKMFGSTKKFVSTNVGVDKIFALTKCWPRQTMVSSLKRKRALMAKLRVVLTGPSVH